MFKPVALYRYQLPNVYLSEADIVNPDFVRVVVGPELVWTSPAFMRSSATQPAGTHGSLARKTVNRVPIVGGLRNRHNFHNSLPEHSDRSTMCRLCRLYHFCTHIISLVLDAGRR